MYTYTYVVLSYESSCTFVLSYFRTKVRKYFRTFESTFVLSYFRKYCTFYAGHLLTLDEGDLGAVNKPTFFGYKVGYGDGAMNVDYVYETLPAFNAAFESTSDVLSKVRKYFTKVLSYLGRLKI